MDVFIPYSANGSGDKETKFAFVRFKYKSEMMKAIEMDNNRRIEGWCIRVKEAAYGWKEQTFRIYNQS
ncbi:hypothetical protein DITRI_Ditri10aG0115500 [Diplodiscus trichospermus]